MKKILFAVIILFSVSTMVAQEASEKKNLKKLPAIDVKTLDGKTLNTKDISNDGKPIVMSFWATWCKPCVAELRAIADVYDDWVEETGVKVVAVSTDDAKSVARVAPFVKGNNWIFDILLDQNKDFQRAMSIPEVPFLCILNGNGEIVWSHTSYLPGSEEEIYKIVKALVAEGKK
ncbi:MAG: TlpA family protein disulfide reductase [Bacteroidales bacterium]|jgi:peroxiredoxin|nr:TlpA family protein disulfide reductase [Bacteroidales bacterium]